MLACDGTDSGLMMQGARGGERSATRIVVWQDNNALRVPSSALFRNGEHWSVFTATDGRAELRPVRIGRNNGNVAEVVDGLLPGDRVILYPSAAISAGTAPRTTRNDQFTPRRSAMR